MTTIRPAVLSDSAFVWRLSMDDSVRAMSTRGDYFSFADHDLWWADKLTNSLNRIWIMEVDGVEVGQVRYGKCLGSNEAEVAISVSPNHQHKGYASDLLRTTMPLACDWLGVPNLVALVLPHNERSRQRVHRSGRATAKAKAEEPNFGRGSDGIRAVSAGSGRWRSYGQGQNRTCAALHY